MTTYFSESFSATSPAFGGDQSWTQFTGAWKNQGSPGQATATLGGAVAYARADTTTPSADMAVTLTVDSGVTIAGGRSIGVMARVTSSSLIMGTTSFYAADFHFDTGNCYLLKCVNGTVSTMTSFGFTVPSLPATVTVSVYGSDIRAYVNGTQVGTTYTDTSITTGNKAGIDTYNSNTDVYFENFVVASAIQAPNVASGAATLSQGIALSAAATRVAEGAATLTQPSGISVTPLYIASANATLSQVSALTPTPTYVGVAAATLTQSNSVSATAGLAALLGQAQTLTVDGTAIHQQLATLSTDQALSAYGFVYYFAESFRVFDGSTFGGDLSWTVLGQSWVNAAVGEGTCGAHGVVGAVIANRDTPSSDMSVRVTVDSMLPNRSVGVIARANSAATSLANLNGYVFEIHGDSGGIYYVLAIKDGVVTILAGPVALPFTAPMVIDVSVKGNQITVLANGIIITTYTDSTVTTGTRAGIFSYNGNSDIRFSNFSVAPAFQQVVINPTGIASATAVGTPSVVPGSITAVPTGLASSVLLGSPVMSGTTGLTPTGIASGAALGVPTLATHVTVSPTGIASTAVVGSPTASVAIHLAPSGIASTAAVGNPTVSATLHAAPTGIAGSSAIGTPTVLPGRVTLVPTGIVSAAALGTVTLHATTHVTPTGIVSSAVIPNPRISTTVSVTPTGITSASNLGHPSLSAITGVRPTGIPSNTSVGSPTIKHRDTYTLAGIASALAVGIPRVVATLTATPTGIASAAGLGTPTLRNIWRATPTGIASTAAVGAVSAGGSVTVVPRGIRTVPTVGKPTATSGRITAVPVGIPSALSVGTPTATRAVPSNPPRDRIRRLAPVHKIMDE